MIISIVTLLHNHLICSSIYCWLESMWTDCRVCAWELTEPANSQLPMSFGKVPPRDKQGTLIPSIGYRCHSLVSLLLCTPRNLQIQAREFCSLQGCVRRGKTWTALAFVSLVHRTWRALLGLRVTTHFLSYTVLTICCLFIFLLVIREEVA